MLIFKKEIISLGVQLYSARLFFKIMSHTFRIKIEDRLV
jgi:hypothetical protein